VSTHLQGPQSLPHDGLHLPTIKRHSLDKLGKHDYYATMFANCSKNKWPQRAYIGLCCGAGRAKVEGTGQIVETAAMSALRLPFTHYIFVDNDLKCLDALEERAKTLGSTADIKYIHGDVNNCVARVMSELPQTGRGLPGLLSLCFADPFSANLKFATIRRLSRFKMDFLILLALAHDIRRNLPLYREPGNTIIEHLIDCPTWRAEFAQFDARGKKIEQFILEKYGEAMKRLRYLRDDLTEHHPVKVTGKGVRLYYLVFFSRHPLGKKLWKAALDGTTAQTELDFDVKAG
jgi:three-Cys-motif partner protein